MAKSFREKSDFKFIESIDPALEQLIARYGVKNRSLFNGVRITEGEDKVILFFPGIFQADKAHQEVSLTLNAFFKKTIEWKWDEKNWNKPRCIKEQDKTRQRFNPHIYYNSDCDKCEPKYGCSANQIDARDEIAKKMLGDLK